MLTVAGDASCSGTDPMLQKHESVKHGLIVVIASDRGLAGGFNTTVERTAEKLAASWVNDGIECEIIACGRKPATYFRDRANVVMHFEGNSSEPDFNQARIIPLISAMLIVPVSLTVSSLSTTTPRTAWIRSFASSICCRSTPR